MLSTTMHRLLANASDSIGPAIFEGQGFRRHVERALDETGRRERRRRGLPAATVVLFVVFMSLYRASGIRNVLKELISLAREQFPALGLRSVTPEAVCHARARLGVEPVKAVFEGMAAEIVVEPSFRGLRVWGYDGVRFTVPDTKANEREFRRPAASRGRAAFPQLMGVALVETSTRQVRDVAFGSCRSSERALALQFLRHVGPGDLLLMDRGCSSAVQFEAFTKVGCHVMGRISAGWKPEFLRQLGPGDHLVRVHAHETREAKKRSGRRRSGQGSRRPKARKPVAPRRKITLKMRMIEYVIGSGSPVRLLTSLLDPRKFPARALALEYHQRWECELAYDEIKTHLVTVTHGTLHTVFRSKTPQGVLQEAYGTFLAYNLIRSLIVEAGRVHGVPPLEISFVDTLEVVKREAHGLEAAPKRKRPALVQRLLQDIAECRNPRPRRHRANPRVVKVKMSNFKLKRRGHRQRTVDFPARLRVTSPRSSRRRAA